MRAGHPTNTAAGSSRPGDYRDYLRVDGTAEGFLELALFHLMGNQFYLSWHAGYNDATAICDRPGLEAIISALERASSPVESQPSRRDRRAPLTWSLSSSSGTYTVTVKLVFFTRWGGFLQKVLTFQP